MERNYADWQLIQLLPIKNDESEFKTTYDSIIITHENEILLDDGKNIDLSDFTEKEFNGDLYAEDADECRLNFKSIYYRPVWSWEDIRLYLQSKDYLLSVLPYFDEELSDINGESTYLYFYRLINLRNNDIVEDSEYFHTYEETRYEGIKYCLKLINSKTITNDGLF